MDLSGADAGKTAALISRLQARDDARKQHAAEAKDANR